MRRCSGGAQEVIDGCWALGDSNPIWLIHDVGAGGLSNALPEAIARTAARGGRIDLRAIPSAEPELSPMELWCNEAPGALCNRAGAAENRGLCRVVRTRALPPTRSSGRSRAMDGCSSRTPCSAATPGRHADRGAARQRRRA